MSECPRGETGRSAGVVVLCNLDSVDVDQLAMHILRIALDIPDHPR